VTALLRNNNDHKRCRIVVRVTGLVLKWVSSPLTRVLFNFT